MNGSCGRWRAARHEKLGADAGPLAQVLASGCGPVADQQALVSVLIRAFPQLGGFA
jgi:hypothetical protein